jgi:hypothetical protein
MKAPHGTTPHRPRRWALWTVPAAAALAAAALTGLATPAGHPPALRPPDGPVLLAATGPGLPSAYVDLNYDGQDVVRSTATGAVTGKVPVSFTDEDGAAVGTSVNGVFYIAGYTGTKENIYRFELTAAGQVTDLSTVTGGDTLGGQIFAMATSGNGNYLAVAVGHGATASITVISLPGGTQRTWRGGLAMKGYQSFSITSLAWLNGGDHLAFTGMWCQYGNSANQVCQDAVHGDKRFTDVRELNVAGSGGSLASTKVLLSQSASVPDIVAATISPDGATITAVVLSGPAKYDLIPSHLAVQQFTTKTGQVSGTLYQRATGATAGWLLSPDSHYRHYLLSGAALFNGGQGPPPLQNKGFNGWINDGKLTNLPPSSGELYGQAW